MASLNKVILIGNLGKDPEVITTKSGKSFITVSLATNEYSNQSGEKKTITQWHNLVCFESSVSSYNFLKQFSKKGDNVFVEGKLSYSEYVDKTGNKRSKSEIIVFTVQGLAQFSDAGSNAPANTLVENTPTKSVPEITETFYTKNANFDNTPTEVKKETPIESGIEEVNDLPF